MDVAFDGGRHERGLHRGQQTRDNGVDVAPGNPSTFWPAAPG